MRQMFTLDEVKHAISGERISKTRDRVNETSVIISGVSTDTRTITEGNIFFGIRGDNFDGCAYAMEALEKGACCVVVDDEKYIPEGGIGIVVKDTVEALGQLANHYRFKLNAKVIAVTGSVGKTSTRNLIAAVIATGKRVHSTKANNNNEIGMSMTILSAPEYTEVIVLEMGMRGFGEISYLTRIACPDIAVITNIGYSHIGRLGSRDNIMKAKMEIAEGLTDGGILAVNADDAKLFDYAKKTLTINKLIAAVTVDESDDDIKSINCPVMVRAHNLKHTDTGIDFNVYFKKMNGSVDSEIPYHVESHCEHAVRNVLFALFVAYMCGLYDTMESSEAIKKVVSDIAADNGRGAVTITKKYLVVNDAYNAAPESMGSAFKNFVYQSKGRRSVLALGGMLELGDFATGLHEMVGKDCAQYHFDRIFVTGDNADDFIRGAHMIDLSLSIVKCANVEDLERNLGEYVKPGDAILFKASHSFGFEKLAERFIVRGNTER